MNTTKRKTAVRAYNQAVYSELQKRGQAPKQALRTIKQYYRPLRQTWGLELNPEAFADEMIKLQYIRTSPQGNTVTIKPHFRTTKGQAHYAQSHKRTGRLLLKSKNRLKTDPLTGKIKINRS